MIPLKVTGSVRFMDRGIAGERLQEADGEAVFSRYSLG